MFALTRSKPKCRQSRLTGLLACWLAGWLAGWLGWLTRLDLMKRKFQLFFCSVGNGFPGNSFAALDVNSPERRKWIPREFVSRRRGDPNFRHVAYPGHLQHGTSVERRKWIPRECSCGIHGSWCRTEQVQKSDISILKSHNSSSMSLTFDDIRIFDTVMTWSTL